ncbi:MAG: tRNA uridine(34) 5-carboxymethylaminomethyl modification radical SAM/GNAT enzyme Elp3 [Candidatus Woesearchaeota archaeon]
MNEAYLDELCSHLSHGRIDKAELSKLKVRLCSKYKVKNVPSDIEILLSLDEKRFRSFLPLLQIKPVRGKSGVTVCAVMSKPMKCPHGKCVYCPGGPKSFFGDVPQSYTGQEPATRRAIRNDFDPYLQIFNRLEQYVCSGHLPEKIELIIMGGTFTSFPRLYQTQFVTFLFKAMNDFSQIFFSKGELDIAKFKDFFELPGELTDKRRAKSIKKKVLALKARKIVSLGHEQVRNETSKVRCVGLTIETRPDYAELSHANFMLELGCTRVELGVQSLDDSVLKKIDRGHSVAATIKATRVLKDLGFKINYHMMLGLPGSSVDNDFSSFLRLFCDQDYRPDMLKIYPCMVMKGTKLYLQYRKGSYVPMSTQDAVSFIATVKMILPEYVRIMRVQRDIPTQSTVAGVDRTNLRQYIEQYMIQHGISCRCIRCREIGRTVPMGKNLLKTLQYDASCGKEFFISLEQGNSLIGFCRLRFPSQLLRKEIAGNSALIRELHVYGDTAKLGKIGTTQHRGFGKMLLKRAESIARKNRKKKIVIISGVGVREYYRKLGYKKEGPYMVKEL